MLICGDDGVGKSTLAHQLIAMRLGLLPADQLLGHTVTEAKGRILYLAMDRPEQARRAGSRLFPKLYAEEKFREVLNERLVVWRGPLPVDPLNEPEALADWLHNEFGSDLSEVMGASRDRILKSMKVEPTAKDKGLVLTLRLVAYDNGILELDGIPLSDLPQEDGWVAGVGVMAQTVHEFQKQVRARRKAL